MAAVLRVEGLGEPVVRLTLDRPQRLNALSLQLVDELRAAFQALQGASPRAVILTGAGRAFCAGADLLDAQFEGPGLGDRIAALMQERYHPMIEALVALPCPLIAAVNGVAAGGGASLALLADLVVAARSATFVQVFTPQLGLVPDLGSTWSLPRLVGRARARGLAMLGDRLDAATAEAWGLIWKAVDDSALLAEAKALAARLASQSPAALAAIKRAIHAATTRTLDEALDHERDAQRSLGFGDDFAEGVAAFLEKRAAKFG